MADVPEQLLHDLAWLKRLATTLAHDRDDADDLVQEAWIAAWRRQPDTSRPMRGWLTKVVRDLAGMKRRSDRRRTARDEHADAPAGAATAEELLAQMRLHERLVQLVLELDEPYRSTVIARFVEGRTSAAIAKSLDIPAGTVRKRLHEALARLRAGLDASAGPRKQWAPAVLAFAKGGMTVAKPTKLVALVLAALLIVGTAVVLLVHPMGRRTDAASSTRATQTTAAAGTAPTGASAASAATDARATLPAISEHQAAEREAMLAAIARAREVRQRGGAPPAPMPTPSSATLPKGSASESAGTVLDIVDMTGDTSEWAKRAHETLNHQLGQCYDLGLAEDRKLKGAITVEFTLVGEPKVGGLLERVDIVDAETTITQQTFRDCITQQLYALELDAPPEGVTIKRQITLQVP
ncbi:MAG: RNA polymerase sigma factor [Deltaproteobacteria bacterium]|nr:RNA polymerase sigma factor [Deltaproteobacteria bacterium]